MWTPRVLTCDLCSQVIDGEKPYPVLSIPLSTEDRERIFAHIKSQLPQQIVFLGLGAAGMIPAAWKLEICPTCLEAALPNAGFVKTNQIIESIQKRQAIHEKNKMATPVDDDD